MRSGHTPQRANWTARGGREGLSRERSIRPAGRRQINASRAAGATAWEPFATSGAIAGRARDPVRGQSPRDAKSISCKRVPANPAGSPPKPNVAGGRHCVSGSLPRRASVAGPGVRTLVVACLAFGMGGVRCGTCGAFGGPPIANTARSVRCQEEVDGQIYHSRRARSARVIWLARRARGAYELETPRFHPRRAAPSPEAAPRLGLIPVSKMGRLSRCSSRAGLSNKLLESMDRGPFAPAPSTKPDRASLAMVSLRASDSRALQS